MKTGLKEKRSAKASTLRFPKTTTAKKRKSHAALAKSQKAGVPCHDPGDYRPARSPQRRSAFSRLLAYFEKHDTRAGFLAALILPAFYFTVLTLTGGIAHAWLQSQNLLGWMAALSLGLGIQIQLFFRLRRLHAEANGAAMGAAAGMSGGAMAACCAHHVADVLPVLGFAAAASVLSHYQDWLLGLGVLSNGAGLLYMLSCYQGAGLKTDGQLDRLFRFDLKQTLRLYLLAEGVFLAAWFLKLWR